ncbi:glutathione S-transferase [Pseudoroseicyclus aestuarii]|uniref:Glutathione S-transferase n=1 Tax=Pseudoroseicyclus aestuarii TaxID=1795041 RepID=A0A318SRN2_9RHOB|nr:glutathione S-transferase [Pseudoroseicyclus aestuarii]PYE84333.1 glutathione S-transferase [Pseudoroseicyclus aestuarii]
MQLLMSPASPFARKVRVVLRETGQTGVQEIAVTTDPLGNPSTVSGANPLGKIPALVRDDGPALYDSRVITRYLDDRAGGGLYPQRGQWEVLTLEATADGLMDAAIAMVYERKFRAPEGQSDEIVEGQWKKVQRALEAAETRWISHLSGPLHIGQIAMGCALGYLDLRHPGRGWRDTAPGLAAWEAKFAQRESMIATRPPEG